MKKLIFTFIVLTMFIMGCAKLMNRAASQGGLFTSHTANYIVVSYSGGIITDVWKLKDVIVQSESNSDGWLFKDQHGNMINIGGDVKVIRAIGNDKLWGKYIEYHMEFENKTYAQKRDTVHILPVPFNK